MPLIDVLRTQTRDKHEALHQHPLLTGLSEAISMADFHRILLAFDAYYTHAEAACFADWPQASPNAPVLEWLGSDLDQHGLSSCADEIAFAHPLIDTPSKLAGYLYTKQGSTLGGHVISKHLERQLGLIPHLDQWFFAGYGHDNGPRWKQFLSVLEAMAPRLDEAEVVEGAMQAFDAIGFFCTTVHALRQINEA